MVSGFGLAPVYAAPLAKWLTSNYGIQNMMLILGLGFVFIITGVKTVLTPVWFGLSQMLQAPGKDYVSEDIIKVKKLPVRDRDNYTPKEMLGTAQFYMLWFMYACGAGAGLMVIAKLALIAKLQAGVELGFILVAVLAIGNGGGRILAGIMSDKIGRKATMFICFVVQAVLILLLSRINEENILGYKLTVENADFFELMTIIIMSLVSILIGANYGANLSLFPSITKDFYGLKNFGVNYGLVFTAWGFGGFVLSLVAGNMYDKYETFAVAYYGASVLLVLAAIMVFFVRTPHHNIEVVETK